MEKIEFYFYIPLNNMSIPFSNKQLLLITSIFGAVCVYKNCSIFQLHFSHIVRLYLPNGSTVQLLRFLSVICWLLNFGRGVIHTTNNIFISLKHTAKINVLCKDCVSFCATNKNICSVVVKSTQTEILQWKYQ